MSRSGTVSSSPTRAAPRVIELQVLVVPCRSGPSAGGDLVEGDVLCRNGCRGGRGRGRRSADDVAAGSHRCRALDVACGRTSAGQQHGLEAGSVGLARDRYRGIGDHPPSRPVPAGPRRTWRDRPALSGRRPACRSSSPAPASRRARGPRGARKPVYLSPVVPHPPRWRASSAPAGSRPPPGRVSSDSRIDPMTAEGRRAQEKIRRGTCPSRSTGRSFISGG